MGSVERFPLQTEVLNPLTGEVVDISQPDMAADMLNRLRASEGYIAKAKEACEAVVLAEMDAQAKWTLRWGALEASAPSPEAAAKPEWQDVPGLMAQLEAEGLAPERIHGDPDSLVTTTISYKVSKREADRISKISRQHRAIIEAHYAPRAKRRHVEVKLGGSA